jgi:hypothetical protein
MSNHIVVNWIPSWYNSRVRYFLLIYFSNKSLHVRRRLAAHHQEDQLCINSNWYMLCVMLTGCWQQQPVNITHDCTSCCLYKVDPPDDEQQACSKHVEAYYWNKLIGNSASCWFILYEFLPCDFDICRYTKLGISLGDRKTRNSAMMFCLCVPYARHNGTVRFGDKEQKASCILKI